MNEEKHNASIQFDHERLDVYQLELRFLEWVTPTLDKAARSSTGRTKEVLDQLDRASLSVLLNTAEGNGHRQRQIRARFFDDARGSATECAACLDALVAKGIALPEGVTEGKALLLRIVSILCRLVERFDIDSQLRDEIVDYATLPNPKSNGHRFLNPRTRTRTRRTTEKGI